MSAPSNNVRPYNKTETLAPKLSKEDLDNLLQILPKLSEKEQAKLLQELSEYENLVQKEKTKDDFLVFVKKMWAEFIPGRHHTKMARAFERVANGECKRLIINMHFSRHFPTGRLKSCW
jgi:hypothetical protein